MTYPFPTDIQEFVSEKMATGIYANEEELFRDAFRALGEEQDDLVAIREAIDDLASGDPGLPLDEAFDRVKLKASSQKQSS